MDDAAVQSLPDDPRLLKALLIERARLLGLRENRIADLEKQNQRIAELERTQAELERTQAGLERTNAGLERSKAELERTNAELELERLRLKQQLMVALKKLYGPRGDRLATEGDVAQLLLEFAVELEARPVDAADLPPDAGAVDPQTVRRVKRRRGRRDLGSDEFDHLPAIRKEHDLNDEDKPCPCCNQPRVKIGEESSWQVACIRRLDALLSHVPPKTIPPRILSALSNLPPTHHGRPSAKPIPKQAPCYPKIGKSESGINASPRRARHAPPPSARPAAKP